mmetsp:Transcript_112273/g.198961  ORF Transcript_112273/g.198961 Transcript_112273/m.198961 type:complete len:237 (+) Transcript_112273:114-824(+)
MAALNALILLASCAAIRAASNLRLRQLRRHGLAGPLDCYNEANKGEDYAGLVDKTLSGRKCKKWMDTDKPDIVGDFCRNPDGGKEKPWCFTMDPSVEIEYCEIPVCPNDGAPLVPWKAPAGAKSEAEENAGPCEYSKPTTPTFTEYKSARACMNNQGTTWWLISNKMVTAADPEGCEKECLKMAGAEYFTFYSTAFTGGEEGGFAEAGNNCGCYRECILVPEELTINGPTSYRMTR